MACGSRWRKPVDQITDRAKRYRANAPECRPRGPKICHWCRTRTAPQYVPDHVDGNEAHNTRGNLVWACKSCNTKRGKAMAKAGRGVRTRQYNPRWASRSKDLHTFFVMGQEAFRAGKKRVPAHDPAVMVALPSVQGRPRGVVQALEHWLRGWDNENLKPNPKRKMGFLSAGDRARISAAVAAGKSAQQFINSEVQRGMSSRAFQESVKEFVRQHLAKLGNKNPGAVNLAQYIQAAMEHTRGAHDAGGKILHETPKAKRREFAREIWFRRGYRNPMTIDAFYDFGIGKYVATTFAGEKFGNMHATGETKKAAIAALKKRVSDARKAGTWRNPLKETVLYGLPKGATQRWEEVLLLTNGTPERIAKAKQLAAKDGFHSFRVAEIDLSRPPDFRKTVNGRRRNSVASTILEQLGGRRFSTMTGAKSFVSSGNSLRFKLPSNFAKRGINLVTITLDPSDTYTVQFMKMRGMNVETIATRDGVYVEDLQRVFKSETGLDTSLGSMGNPDLYKVTRKFIGGTLKGLTHSEVTPVKFKVGQVVKKPIGGSPYKITAVIPAGKNPATKIHKHFAALSGWHSSAADRAYAFADQMRSQYPGRKVEVYERTNGSWDVYVLNEPAGKVNPFDSVSAEFRRFGFKPAGAGVWRRPDGGFIELSDNDYHHHARDNSMAERSTPSIAHMVAHLRKFYGRTNPPADIMPEFRAGRLRSSSGRLVRKKTQARAILLSELRRAGRIPARSNPNIVDAIRPGDRVTILTPHGNQLTGRAVMRSSSGGWVLNLGGRHGTPGIATEENIIRVKLAKRNPVEFSAADKRELSSFWNAARIAGYHSFGDRVNYVKREWERAHPGEGMRAYKYAVSAFRGYGHNPDGNEADAAYKTFHGKAPDRTKVKTVALIDPYNDHPDLWQLGKLKSLTVGEFVDKFEGRDGEHPKSSDPNAWATTLEFEEDNAPDLAGEPGGRQLFIVGGDQNADRYLSALRVDPGKETVDCGNVYRIEYFTRKDFDKFRPINYWHHFGEETGVQPRLIYDRTNHRLQLAGGEYVVKREGIIN